MKIFRRTKDEVVNEQKQEQCRSEADSESITIFKKRERKADIPAKGKSRNTPKHG